MAESTRTPTIPSSAFGFFRRVLACYEFLAWGGWWLVLVVLLFRALAGVHPLFELATHFAMHALVVACVGFLVASTRCGLQWRRIPPKQRNGDQWLKLVIFALGLAVLAPIVRPWELLPRGLDAKPDEPTLRVLSWNIWLDNWSALEAQQVIETSQADVVILYELNPQLAQRIDGVRSGFVAEDWHPEWNPGSIVMLSRIEGVQFERRDPAKAGMPAIELSIPAGRFSKPCKLLALHTKSPTPLHPSRTRVRDQQLVEVGEWAKSQSVPHAVMGDLNITPWSPAFSRVLADSGLRDTRIGHGNQASWPSFLGPLGIPIDHVLVGGGMEAIRREVLSGDFGSDHAPVLIELRQATK